MTRDPIPPATRAERAAFVALASVVSLLVLFIFLVHPGLTGHPRADFPEVVDGTAHRPYVARALIPLAVRALATLAPETAREAVAASLRGRGLVDAMGWYDEYLLEFAVATAIMFVCLVLFAWVLKRLTEVVYAFPHVVGNLAPIVALCLLPLYFRYYSYPYDPATLLLYSSALLFLLRRRFFWFTLMVALAAANKETSILLLPLYAFHEWTRDRRVPFARLALVALAWGVVRGALMWIYRDNPGVIVENHFVEHTVWLFTKFPMAMRYTIVVVALFAFPVANRWREKPSFLRGGLVLTLAPLVIAGVIFGFADELRGYYEAFPFLYLLALPSVMRWLGCPPPATRITSA